jgi:predicted Rossmann fold flavoprotein
MKRTATDVKKESAAKKAKAPEVWDLVVVGGGPAGMMAAGRAAELGVKVLVIEKNDSLGKKLLITGGGRCNVTNAEPDVRKLLAKFKGKDKFLFSTFSQWSVSETLAFFEGRGMKTKVENEGRVFPVSDSAQSVWDVLVSRLKEKGVTVLSRTPVLGFVREGKKITGVKVSGGREIKGRAFILATGGKSRPETGSTGDGFKWLSEIGHQVAEAESSLVPVALRDAWVKKAAGVSLPSAKLTLYQNGVKQQSGQGKMLFTHQGISGPAVLNLSRDVGELLKYGPVSIQLDLAAQHDYGQLNAKLQELFRMDANNKKLKNALGTLVPPALVASIVELSKIDGEKQCNAVTREERLALVQLLKAIPLTVKGLMGLDKAVVTSGGAALHEVDFKSMRSALYPNLYLVGDILNIDRPSGGYSLQLCWTTGYVAGTHAAEALKEARK